MLSWWEPATTRIVIGISFLAYAFWDVVLAAAVSNEATWSKQMQWIGLNWPIVVVAYGGLGAHFFCPQYSAWQGWWIECRPGLLLLIGWVAFRIAWAQAFTGVQ